MSHLRFRHILPPLLTRLRFSPVVAIQGARQTGKSILAREILCKRLKSASYFTLDEKKIRDFVSSNPETFLEQNSESVPLVIDEAQKAPDLFDAVKAAVDKKRIPGRYVLLGSTEFSKLTRVRESLTGRMSRIRLFPMNLAETLDLPANPSRNAGLVNERSRVTRKQLLRFLEQGGFPGFFAVRSEMERNSLMQDWIELTTLRDAASFHGIKIDPELCLEALQQTAQLEMPSEGEIARVLKTDPRRIKTLMSILCALFVVHKLPPYPLGFGRPLYYLCDSGIARQLGASFERQLCTWVLLEQLSQRSYRDERESTLYHYQTRRGGKVHFVIDSPKETTAIKIFSEESIDLRSLESLLSIQNKVRNKRITTIALGAMKQVYKDKKIIIYPWESLV